jgi:hypothetical protein
MARSQSKWHNKLLLPTRLHRAGEHDVWDKIMMEIQGKRLQIENTVLDMPHTILDARQIGERIVVIFDYMDFPRWRQAQNLRSFDTSGKELWTAEHPTNETADCYVNFMKERPLTVGNFAGYRCVIDEATGKLLKSEFAK